MRPSDRYVPPTRVRRTENAAFVWKCRYRMRNCTQYAPLLQTARSLLGSAVQWRVWSPRVGVAVCKRISLLGGRSRPVTGAVMQIIKMLGPARCTGVSDELTLSVFRVEQVP
jgi:hypothetical protein